MPRNARGEGLSRRHRFAAQGSFGAVLRQGRKLRGRHTVIHAAPGKPGASRLGIALARRMVASSVERNRLKRVVRELFRCHPIRDGGFDIVVMLRERFESSSEAAIAAELRDGFGELAKGA